MALLINKQIDNILGSIIVNEIYIRLSLNMGFSGNDISVWAKNYLSKNGYLLNSNTTNIEISGLNSSYNLLYDRVVDTPDILLYAHQKMIDDLTADKYGLVVRKDPSTGAIVYDPSTHQPVFDNVIIKLKFCELSEISIIDID